MDTHELRKRRGAFFTPPGIAEYLVKWAVRSPHDKVLEPSCGEAGFLLAAARRLEEIGANPLSWNEQLHGVEVHDLSAREASNVLRANGFDAHICVRDFFEYLPEHQYDAIVGNPPFVRYQNFSGAARARSLEAALSQGVRLSGLASSWAAFVVKASLHLAPDGRLALVLPAELLSVKYAEEVRRFLLKRFKRLRLVVFDERVFPGVLEEVVLLLAEGKGGASCFEVYQSRDSRSLQAIEAAPWTAHVPDDNGKWTPALMAKDAFTVYQALAEARFEPLRVWGSTYLGAVTGNNRFFALTRDEASRYGLADIDLMEISPPGSRHLHGLEFSGTNWQALAEQDARGFLFYPENNPSEPAMRYIEHGMELGVANAYKCRTRSPWWRVPLVGIPDLFLTYMNHGRPKLITNSARVHILNSLYGVSLCVHRRELGKALLPVASVNSVTLLGSEIVGRAYGGGLVKLEPREADRLPMPSFQLIENAREALESLKPRVADWLSEGNVRAAVAAVDEILLAGISKNDLCILRTAREMLLQRRQARGRRGEDR